LALIGNPSYTALMSAPTDPSHPADQPDPRIELLRRALELAGVEPLVAASLAQEHYGRITVQGDRFEVSDQEGHPYDVPQPGESPILYLAERLKQGIPAKFLTDDALKREGEP
jgi:hypothetical protein